MDKYQEGGLPSVQIDTGFLGERVNPVNINFNPNPVPIQDNTIAALQLGISRDNQKIAQRQLDQSERRLDMDVMKFNKELIADAIKRTQAGSDNQYGVNNLTEGGRRLTAMIQKEVSNSQNQANALWAETMISGKVTPINIGKLNQATAGIDKILNSDDYVFHVSANKAYQGALDELYKNLDDPNTVVDTEEFKKKEEKILQVLNSDASQPRDFRMADVFDFKNVFLKRVDFEEEAAEMIKNYQTDNTKEQARFFRGNPAIVEKFTSEDMRNAGKIPDIMLEKWKLSSQGRAFIEKMGGEDKTKSWLSKMVELEIPNVGKLTETTNDLDPSRYTAGFNQGDKTTDSGGGSLSERDREPMIKALNDIGKTIQFPSTLDKDIKYTYNKESSFTEPSTGKTISSTTSTTEEVSAEVAITKYLDPDTSPDEKKAIEKALGIKNFQAPSSTGAINTNAAGGIQTEFSKFDPSSTNWDLLADVESSGGVNVRAHDDNGEVSVGPYQLRGPNIQKFLAEKHNLPNADVSTPEKVQALWDTFSKEPGFEEGMRDWISKELHEPLINKALKVIPVIDNSLKTYLIDAAHQLGGGKNSKYDLMLRRSQEIMKEKGLSHSKPFEVLQAVHEARAEIAPSPRLEKVYAESSLAYSAQAKIANKLPFTPQVDPRKDGQSNQSLLELEYGMLVDLDKAFANSLPLVFTSAARGKYHEATKKNPGSDHPKQRAIDFEFNNNSIEEFKKLTGRTEFTPFTPYPIPGTSLEVMYEDNPRHFHVSYKGEKVEVPSAPQPAGNPNQQTINDLFLQGKGTGPSPNNPQTQSTQIQQDEKRTESLLGDINPKLK